MGDAFGAEPGAGPVPREALDYFSAKGLQVGFNYDDVWREEHAVAFTVAKVMSEDVLATVRGSLERALAEGVTFQEWKRGIAEVLDKAGWSNYNGGATLHRFRIIYDTNMRVARAAGQWQRIERNKDLLPYLSYNLGPSQRHRVMHESWEGVTLPVDDQWWDDHIPPSGYGCKCWISQETRRRVEARGGPSERPPSRRVRHVHPKTGAVTFAPEGIDPGWDYNPGKARRAGIDG